MSYQSHRMYLEYVSLINDDAKFAELYQDNEDDFYNWVIDYEIDKDWEATT
jgi:hypothetical protein